jgi:ribosomal protein L37AE/L43A
MAKKEAPSFERVSPGIGKPTVCKKCGGRVFHEERINHSKAWSCAQCGWMSYEEPAVTPKVTEVTKTTKAVKQPEEPKPKKKDILPDYFPETTRFSSFTIVDPKGISPAKKQEYIWSIIAKYPHMTMPELEKARVDYSKYRAVFTLSEISPVKAEPSRVAVSSKKGKKETLPKDWRFLEEFIARLTGFGDMGLSQTPVARFWEIYYSPRKEVGEDFPQMKTAILSAAKQQKLKVKPDKAAEIDHYFYCLYTLLSVEKVQAPKIIPWFLKTFFESSAARQTTKAPGWCPVCAADLDEEGHCTRNPSHTAG